ncbi:apoptosis facilitator Bcl-2-like protein 14 isoform X2 [Lampris incognitus]|uniref:apoptosis facilitator Bcl-2-like protein 14 isoform X2 n=1 Tax=Lampris incognitus TaxID=2546036 RepID=UPI0024B4A6EF|nr:apoptosis facilitator Bcl-2-like protein 14 isoform X2 [Lampris incognitus]
MERQGGDGSAESEEFQLLLAYCQKRTRQRPLHFSGGSKIEAQGPVNQNPDMLGSGISQMNRSLKRFDRIVVQGEADGSFAWDRRGFFEAQGFAQALEGRDADGPPVHHSALSGVADRLVQIATSSKILEADLEADSVEGHKDVIEKLVELLKKSGDDLDKQIAQNKVLQQTLRTAFNYTLFEKVTAALQGQVKPSSGGRAAGSEGRLHRQQIAFAFEVTSRLSSVDIIPKRRVLAFGEQYIRQHHSIWVQQHGGWEKAFDSEDVD